MIYSTCFGILFLVGKKHLVTTAEPMPEQSFTAPLMGQIHSQTSPPPNRRTSGAQQQQRKRARQRKNSSYARDPSV